MIKDWNFWFSIITAVVAIIALWLNKQQIRLNNKQHLFDKRLENYIIASGLIQLYNENKKLFDKKLNKETKEDKSIIGVDLDFYLMTRNTYLEKISPVIHHALEQTYQKEFLIKLENLKDVATKLELLFNISEAAIMSRFVYCYQELLHSMYRYKAVSDYMSEEPEKYGYSLEKAKELFGEQSHRVELQEAFENIKNTYQELKENEVEAKIKKEIRIS